MPDHTRPLLFGLLFFIVANLIYLDIKLTFVPKNTTLDKAVVSEIRSPITPSLSPTLLPTTPTSNPLPSSQLVNQSIRQLTDKPSVHEYYIPFGTGKTSVSDWEDIAGTETTIDTANYGRIKAAYFETNIYVPTGNGKVSARLYNVTDKHPAWFAEAETESNKSILLTSKPIVLEKGSKIYRIQMKSTLSVQAVMDMARVKLTTYN